VSAGGCGGYCRSTLCCSASTAACNYRMVVTIFVVFVDCGDSSNCSTHLILFRRFSILHANLYSVDSFSCSFPPVSSYCCVSVSVYCMNYPCSTLNFSSKYFSNFYYMVLSPCRLAPLAMDQVLILVVLFKPSSCC
jgi:hypothetical protein